MRSLLSFLPVALSLLAASLGFAESPAKTPSSLAAPPAEGTAKTIPFDQLGATAQKQYSGDGISITPTADGASLRAAFQKLEGRATPQGLWLQSTAEVSRNPERFRVLATAVGRADTPPSPKSLPPSGTVHVSADSAAFIRPHLIEEYRVSMDGVRQDFLVLERPAGTGKLTLQLQVTGAQASQAPYGAKLTLHGSGREIAYSRLHVTDANGRELTATLEVVSHEGLAVRVDDADAAYPVRIDPTFSDADWVSMGDLPGTDGAVIATAVDAAGNLYIGGAFSAVGGTLANNIAKWDGSAWSSLGSGLSGSLIGPAYVNSIAVSGANVYAGGNFTTAGVVPVGNVAKWNGTSWSALGSDVVEGVNALAASGDDLYVGGSFFSVGEAEGTAGIAKWNGNSWSTLSDELGGLLLEGVVFALVISGTDLYVGGDFTVRDPVNPTINNIAKWNGSEWSALGSGLNSAVTALAVSGTDVYAGGHFNRDGGEVVELNRIAKWNGISWSNLGGVSQTVGSVAQEIVSAVAVVGTDIYAVATFFMGEDQPDIRFAKWSGSAWTYPTASAPSVDTVLTLAAHGADLYIGGSFFEASGKAASNIVKLNGNTYSSLGGGTGLNSPVQALVISGTELYAGGSFNLPGTSAKGIAKWNGSAWSALGSGMANGSGYVVVNALAASGTDIYAGGFFNTAGGVSANHIAKWNGTAWSALGSGVDSTVSALAVSGTDLYAVGDFTTAGGVSANHIAKWNGSAWNALGSGIGGRVFDLAVSGTDLYAGGDFATAGGVSANKIAKWNGSAWSALGSGLNGFVEALAVSGTDLYVGGGFTTAGGMSAHAIAKWDGGSWSALGSGMANGPQYVQLSVHVLAASGPDLYAGGNFTTAGAVSANYIAKWNGSAWSPFGSGANSYVYALAVSGTDLYAGGSFSMAGGKISPYLARANLAGSSPGITVAQPAGTPIADGTSKTFPTTAVGTSNSLTFTITNTGTADLTGLTITKDGTHASDFTVTAYPTAPVSAPSGSTTFTIQFSPTTGGAKTAAIHIASNDADENPYDITLTGQALSFTADTDGDGLNDASELQLAALGMGFDWQISQTSLVTALTPVLNGAGYFTPAQVQALNLTRPLIQRNATTGQFTLTLGLEKSTNLINFSPFQFTAPQTTINAQGKIEFQFTVPDNAAFFQLRAQ